MNETLNCQLSCKLEPWQWDIVCDNWNITESCSKTKTDKLKFTALMHTAKLEIIGNCFAFVIDSGIFPESKLS